jgi:hypothetical protein
LTIQLSIFAFKYHFYTGKNNESHQAFPARQQKMYKVASSSQDWTPEALRHS